VPPRHITLPFFETVLRCVIPAIRPGRAESHGFEYVRHGMLSLYAALNVGTGQVEGMTASRHISQEFVAFLDPNASGGVLASRFRPPKGRSP